MLPCKASIGGFYGQATCSRNCGAYLSERVEQIEQLLAECTDEERREIFARLRSRYSIHPLEDDFGVQAEIILEAIARAPDLSQRGVRGLIAEATCKVHVIDKLAGWEDVTPDGNHAFDFLVERAGRQVKIQLKMQRKKVGVPMRANKALVRLSAEKFVTETQRTRGGIDPETGEDTRPYRFGEFAILAVSMEPATRDWSQFRYTLERWLIPRPENNALVLKFQPVPLEPDDDWTDNLATCIQWLDSDVNKTIAF